LPGTEATSPPAPAPARLPYRFIRREAGWLTQHLAGPLAPPPPPQAALIEARASATQALGPQPLWDGYAAARGRRAAPGATRSPDTVRTRPLAGQLFAWLAASRRPEAIVEFGTAFGVSGMYWLAGLEQAGTGHLFTFEPNAVWADIARSNLAAVSARFTLTGGTFEAHAKAVLGDRQVDIAFVDAIHTRAFVFAQYEVLRPLMRPGGLVLFDDIGFSKDMAEAWTAIAEAPEIRASVAIGTRLGIVELPMPGG
jgi:predicted O-methyltransferase YrrM